VPQFDELLEDADSTLFKKVITDGCHVLHQILPLLSSRVAKVRVSSFEYRKAFLSYEASNNGEMAKTSLHTHTAVARLPGVS